MPVADCCVPGVDCYVFDSLITLSNPTNNPTPPFQIDAHGTNLYDDFNNEVTPETLRAEMTAELDRLRAEIRTLRDTVSPRRPGSADPNGNPRVRPDMRIVNGMMIPRTSRDDDEVGMTLVALSRFSRFDSAADKRKVRERCCSALKNKFVLLDYSKLTGSDTSGSDLGAMVLAQTNALNDLKEWAEQYDVQYLLNMPDVASFLDPELVALAPKKDLLTEYRSFSRPLVTENENFVTFWMADVDTESSQWLLEVLKASTSKAILAEISQE